MRTDQDIAERVSFILSDFSVLATEARLTVVAFFVAIFVVDVMFVVVVMICDCCWVAAVAAVVVHSGGCEGVCRCLLWFSSLWFVVGGVLLLVVRVVACRYFVLSLLLLL